jgi:glutamate--cysteine ligase
MTLRHQELPALAGRLSAAEAWIPHTCFKHGPPGRIGIELELLVRGTRAPSAATDGPDFDPMRAAVLALSLAGRVTTEPGGQVELSSPPGDHLLGALQCVDADLARLRATAAEHGATLDGRGRDPRVVHRRLSTQPRYAAMERYLDRWGPAGRQMMRNTASVQVNVEAGADSQGLQHRWELLHAVGPSLLAAFATSPGPPGAWHGWARARWVHPHRLGRGAPSGLAGACRHPPGEPG